MSAAAMRLNVKVALLLLGLLVGAVAGYVTRPEAAEIRIGGTSIEFQGNAVATGRGSLTTGQSQHVLFYTLAGGVIGLLAGFAVDRRR